MLLLIKLEIFGKYILYNIYIYIYIACEIVFVRLLMMTILFDVMYCVERQI